MTVFSPNSSVNMNDKPKTILLRKLRFGEKLRDLLDNYDTFLIISIDNVSTKHLDEIRKDYRGIARFLFGKNVCVCFLIHDNLLS